MTTDTGGVTATGAPDALVVLLRLRAIELEIEVAALRDRAKECEADAQAYREAFHAALDHVSAAIAQRQRDAAIIHALRRDIQRLTSAAVADRRTT